MKPDRSLVNETGHLDLLATKASCEGVLRNSSKMLPETSRHHESSSERQSGLVRRGLSGAAPALSTDVSSVHAWRGCPSRRTKLHRDLRVAQGPPLRSPTPRRPWHFGR